MLNCCWLQKLCIQKTMKTPSWSNKIHYYQYTKFWFRMSVYYEYFHLIMFYVRNANKPIQKLLGIFQTFSKVAFTFPYFSMKDLASSQMLIHSLTFV